MLAKETLSREVLEKSPVVSEQTYSAFTQALAKKNRFSEILMNGSKDETPILTQRDVICAWILGARSLGDPTNINSEIISANAVKNTKRLAAGELLDNIDTLPVNAIINAWESCKDKVIQHAEQILIQKGLSEGSKEHDELRSLNAVKKWYDLTYASLN